MDESNWQKQLLIGVVMLLVVGGLIGVVVAVAGLKAANLAGIGDTKPTGRSDERLHVPRRVGSPAPSSSQLSSTPPTTASSTSARPRRAISLQVSPTSVGTFQHINLSGTYKAPDGTALRVQRKENGVWTDFPTTAHVKSGSFATYIETGHTGSNLLRVTDPIRARSSNVVTVTVH